MIRDVFRAYPEITGIRLDWPEYPPYFLDDCFLDFSVHAKDAAARLGFDAQRMARDSSALYQKRKGSGALHPRLHKHVRAALHFARVPQNYMAA